jgi:hypothetical protein
MKTYILSSICALLIFISCNKDKFQTTPQISIKRVSDKKVPVNGNLVVTLSYTDKEGDIDNNLDIIRERLNKKNTEAPLVLPFPIVQFPDTDRGDIQIDLKYFDALTLSSNAIRIPGSNPPRFEVDTLRLKFVLTDKAGNVSDTVILNDVYVTR